MRSGGALRRVRPGFVLATVALAFASLGATCVDGATPDCSDPKVQCGPSNVDGSADAPDTSTILPEAAPDVFEGGDEPDAEDPDAADAGDEI